MKLGIHRACHQTARDDRRPSKHRLAATDDFPAAEHITEMLA